MRKKTIALSAVKVVIIILTLLSFLKAVWISLDIDEFLYYWEEHPAYALSYALSLQNPVLFQWIEENYGNAQQIETDYMILLRKE